MPFGDPSSFLSTEYQGLLVMEEQPQEEADNSHLATAEVKNA